MRSLARTRFDRADKADKARTSGQALEIWTFVTTYSHNEPARRGWLQLLLLRNGDTSAPALTRKRCTLPKQLPPSRAGPLSPGEPSLRPFAPPIGHLVGRHSHAARSGTLAFKAPLEWQRVAHASGCISPRALAGGEP